MSFGNKIHLIKNKKKKKKKITQNKFPNKNFKIKKPNSSKKKLINKIFLVNWQ